MSDGLLRQRLWFGAWLLASLLCVAGLYAMLDAGPLRLQLGELRLQLTVPRALSVVGLCPWIVGVALQSLADLPPWQRVASGVARSLLLLALALALAQPVQTLTSHRVSAVFAVDVSDSVTDEALARARRLVAEVLAEPGEHRMQVITFAGSAGRVELEPGAREPSLPREARDTAQTDLAEALRLAAGLHEPGYVRRTVLISDGLETRGSVLAEAARLERHQTRLYTLPMTAPPPAEVGIRALSLPPRVRAGEPFSLQAELFATRPTKVVVRAYQGDAPNGLAPRRTLELPRGTTLLELPSVAHVAGPLSYRLELATEGDDRFEENNRFEASVRVEGNPRVLLVDPEPDRVASFARALGAASFDVDVRTPVGLPRTAPELSAYDFVVLSDTPAEAVDGATTRALEAYVKRGGGFMMAGGEHGFGLGGYRGTAMEELLPVDMDAVRRKDQPSLALSLVLDKSGSMEGQKIRLAKEAARATAEALGGEDYIGVIGFDARPQRVVRMQSAGNRLGVSRDIGRLSAGGGTAIFPALDAAYGDLSATRARIKHVILLTDGQTEETGLSLLVRNMRADGITVSVVGLGDDVNRSLLSDLARLGGGRSYFTAAPHNIPRLFVRETHEVSRSAAVESYVRVQQVARAGFLQGVGVGGAPLLRGYVATRLSPPPAQSVLESELGEPLLARWRVGLGWVLAWTSDLKARWAIDWLRWPRFSKLFGQLVREHMRPRPEAALPLEAELRGDVAHVAVDALSADDRFLNGLHGELWVEPQSKAGAAETPPRRLPLPQRAPGRYATEVPLSNLGSFLLRAELRDDEGQLVARAAGSLTRPFPTEYARFEPAPELLRAAAETTGGRLLGPDVTAALEPDGQSVERVLPRWPWCVWAALLLWLVDLALRRVRLGGAGGSLT